MVVLGEVSHLLYVSVIVTQVTEHPLIQLRGCAHSVSLLTILYSQLSTHLWCLEAACYAGDFLGFIVPAIQGQPVYSAVDRISPHSSSKFNLSGAKYMLCIFQCSSIGVFHFWKGIY